MPPRRSARAHARRLIARIAVAWLSSLALVLLVDTGAADAGWRGAPDVPDLRGAIRGQTLHTLRDGRKLGNRGDVFAKVGDSLSESAAFMQGFGCGRWRPGAYDRLRAAVRFFSRRGLSGSSTYCPDANSFSRDSAATRRGQTAEWALRRGGSYDPRCRGNESPLACELRLTRPASAVILFGTNDVALAGLGFDPYVYFTTKMSRIIDVTRAAGVVPVLSTIPPREDDPTAEPLVEELNLALYRLARARRVPLINLWRAATGLPALGLASDRLHLSVFRGPDCIGICDPDSCAPACQPAALTPAGLRYGYNVRNLITLETLRRLLSLESTLQRHR